MWKILKRWIGQRSRVRLAWHWAKAFAAALRFGFPAKELRIVAVTGTDGKTTTVSMTAHILREQGMPVGAVSTSFMRIRETIEQNPTHQTSLSPFALQRFLRRCVDAGCATVVVEASSHGLVQHRLDFLWPEVAAITNTSLEHLDYHGTMEQYRRDKGILCRMLRGKGTKILNADDETFAMYRSIPSKKTIVYSGCHGERCRTMTVHVLSHFDRAQCDNTEYMFSLSNIAVTPTNSSATVTSRSGDESKDVPLTINLPGSFNLENALCAIACASAVGIPMEKSIPPLASFKGVPGRMERIDEGQPFLVFVDFTVTPRAYEKTLKSAKQMLEAGKRLLVLTGTCGDRMREKRPMIGKTVSELADVVIVTEDETLTEDPMRTIEDLWAGIDQSRCQAQKILDRREAIAKLFSLANPGDIVLLCGMGACTTMQTREGLRPWDERQVARELLVKIQDTKIQGTRYKEQT
ncbi:UDP-N-acetylmuramyl-tripeptide synthetase [Candidatus Peregrinibacteria bacterium]|nr:UDP-N-acetylmuramyl-tripeptide synthetase [Candidatus Peregrinibacteria bacterium]MBI3816225.1 UDP-N-acetylmuramyl-tripeptide synthetase [Candidatus Peregrinibacteria bacterium]